MFFHISKYSEKNINLAKRFSELLLLKNINLYDLANYKYVIPKKYITNKYYNLCVNQILTVNDILNVKDFIIFLLLLQASLF